MSANGLIQRMPVSVVGSIGLHGAVMGLLFYSGSFTKKENMRVISNVDLIVPVKKPVALPQPIARTPTPPSTWNFLKMALPTAPKIEPKPLNIESRIARQNLMKAEPKLQDKGRMNAGPKIEQLDLDNRRLDMAEVDIKTESRKAALAQLPRLEEVGQRRVANLPQAMALEERRQEAARLQGLQAQVQGTERRGAAPIARLQEAEGAPPANSGSRFSQAIASLLPAENPQFQIKSVATGAIGQKIEASVPEPPARKAAEAMGSSKKGVELEGPIKNRRVMHYEIPRFPDWAKQQGILEAVVSIRFWVSRQGEVLSNMRVEHTSGYGRLDKLAMEALKNWKFAPILVEERQWGVITFRFILE
ncbi:MAG: energy transducer TonB [Elusimicrobia bacterium]|nr:energy transducer TonB [Elusimicrobiota bacterium]